MAPIRRYLRITKYSVLECRIYLDNPALAHSWLLNPRAPILPRVIESVRPLVLPKLREEKERAKKKGTKKRGIRDVVYEDDFEVSVFLTETSTRHSLLYKHKHIRDKTQTKLVSNSNRLTGLSRDAPIDVEDHDLQIQLPVEDDDEDVPALRHEDSDEDEAIALDDVPAIGETTTPAPRTRQSKRTRRGVVVLDEDNGDSDDFQMEADQSSEGGEDDAELPAPKRLRDGVGAAEKDDKKKLAVVISYEGFAIYGRVLCLVVKRREAVGSRQGGQAVSTANRTPVGQAMMEDWITSTQMPAAVGAEPDAT